MLPRHYLILSHINCYYILDNHSDHTQHHDRMLAPLNWIVSYKAYDSDGFLIVTHIFIPFFFLNNCLILVITFPVTLILNFTLTMNFIHPLILAWALLLCFHTLTLNLILKLIFFIIVLEILSARTTCRRKSLFWFVAPEFTVVEKECQKEQ